MKGLVKIAVMVLLVPVLAHAGSERSVGAILEQMNKEDIYSVLSELHTPDKRIPTKGALTLPQIEAYLNHLTTMVAEFEQYTSQGEHSTGRFYLSRPGRLRWEYDPPVPLVIVVSKTQLTMLDRDLDQLTFGSTEDHLAALLTKPHIHLQEDVKVASLSTNSGVTRLTLLHRSKPEMGKMTLLFHANPIALMGMEVEDAQHHLTTVHFHGVLLGSSLDNSLFVLKDPRIFKKR